MSEDKYLEELLKVIREEPKQVSLEQMAQERFIRLFYEPEHSQQVIRAIQTKYNISNEDIEFIRKYGEYDPIAQGFWLDDDFFPMARLMDPDSGCDIDWVAHFELARQVALVADKVKLF